jgi:hypothetical protein
MTHAEADSGVFGHGQLGTFHFGWAYIEISDDVTESVTATESRAQEYQASYTENIGFTETLASVYEMSYDEIITLIETVGAAYDWKSACVYLTCTLDKPKSIALNCKLKC